MYFYIDVTHARFHSSLYVPNFYSILRNILQRFTYTHKPSYSLTVDSPDVGHSSSSESSFRVLALAPSTFYCRHEFPNTSSDSSVHFREDKKKRKREPLIREKTDGGEQPSSSEERISSPDRRESWMRNKVEIAPDVPSIEKSGPRRSAWKEKKETPRILLHSSRVI